MEKDIRTMDLDSSETYESKSFLMNCHVCGKTFSPLSALIHPTDYKAYYLGTYARLCRITLSFESYAEVCEHIKQISMAFIYDPKDDMQGKILE
jgi:hypothetical protein